MQKSILHLLLKKIADGDVSAKQKIVPRLADRLIMVATKSSQSVGRETKISVITLRENDRKIIPIFTTMPLLKSWLEKNEIVAEGMSMNCADICLSLSGERWIMVDPGTDYWCEIEPEYVKQIAAFEPEDDDFFPEDVKVKPMATNDNKPRTPETKTEPVIELKEPLAPINRTIEVPILPKEIAQFAKMNPSPEVKSFPRLRQKSEEDVRSTMDLTNFRKKFTP